MRRPVTPVRIPVLPMEFVRVYLKYNRDFLPINICKIFTVLISAVPVVIFKY